MLTTSVSSLSVIKWHKFSADPCALFLSFFIQTHEKKVMVRSISSLNPPLPWGLCSSRASFEVDKAPLVTICNRELLQACEKHSSSLQSIHCSLSSLPRLTSWRTGINTWETETERVWEQHGSKRVLQSAGAKNTYVHDLCVCKKFPSTVQKHAV